MSVIATLRLISDPERHRGMPTRGKTTKLLDPVDLHEVEAESSWCLTTMNRSARESGRGRGGRRQTGTTGILRLHTMFHIRPIQIDREDTDTTSHSAHSITMYHHPHRAVHLHFAAPCNRMQRARASQDGEPSGNSGSRLPNDRPDPWSHSPRNDLQTYSCCVLLLTYISESVTAQADSPSG